MYIASAISLAANGQIRTYRLVLLPRETMRCLALAVAAHALVAPTALRRPTALRTTTTDADEVAIETVDDLLDAPQVNCARGVCVIDETEPEVCEFDENMEEIGGGLTHVERMRLQAAMQALREEDQTAE